MVSGAEITATEAFAKDEIVDPASTRSAPAPAIDIVVRWGDSVLAVHELSPPRSFFVGEHDANVVLPAEILGVARLPVILTRWDGHVRLLVSKTARILLGSHPKRMSAARLISRGFAQASSSIPEAAEVPFAPGQTATLFLGTVAIDIHFSTAAPRCPYRPLVEKRVLAAQIASFALHAVLLGILLFFIGPPEVDADYGMTADQLNELQRRLWRLERKENERRWNVDGYEPPSQRNDPIYAAAQQVWMDSLGAASNRWSEELAAEASRDNSAQSTDSSLIGVLYDWPAPPPGPKPKLTIADVMKMPQVVLPEEQPKGRGRRFRGPQVRVGAVTVSGRLPPEVIQRIVRQSLGRFRLCYEQGLRRNPVLQGRVTVRFVIGNDGATSRVSNGGSDLPDSGVSRCVIQQFYNVEFPQPGGGIATVIVPIMFAPPDPD